MSVMVAVLDLTGSPAAAISITVCKMYDAVYQLIMVSKYAFPFTHPGTGTYASSRE